MTIAKSFLLLVLVIPWISYQGFVHAKVCNVALCRPTNQSSIYPSNNDTIASSCNAVDGIKDVNLYHYSCMQTDRAVTSWWQVNLGNVYNVTHVNITMREDGVDNYKKVGDTSIYAGLYLDSNGILNKTNCKCADYWSGPYASDLGKPLQITCNKMIPAQYVLIERYAFLNNSLSFCEMEVFASVESPECPNPPIDWTCRNLDHRMNSPRPECISGWNGITSTESFTTVQATTTNAATTTEKLTTVIKQATTNVLSTDTSTTNSATTKERLTTVIDQTTTTVLTTKNASSITMHTTDTTKLTTTTDTTVISNNTTAQICYCPCGSSGYWFLSDAELQQKIDEIIKEIKIDPKETSSAKRKLISVNDSRPSAKAIGSLGIIILVTVASFIVIMDVDIIFRNCVKCKEARKKTTNKSGIIKNYERYSHVNNVC